MAVTYDTPAEALPRRRRLPSVGAPAVQPPGPPQMAPQDGVPPGGYNNPVNAPVNDPDALPPRPAVGQPFGVGKAQGGDGPANNTTAITDGVTDPGQRPLPVVGSTTPTTVRPPAVVPTIPRIPRTSLIPVGTPFAQDRRYQSIDPTDSTRLTGARNAADAAATASAGFDQRAATNAGADDAARRMATPDVGFTRMNTDVTRKAIDPNVGYQAVDTDVSAGPAVDPSVSADLMNYRQKQMAAANNLTSGPSRSALAEREMAAFDASGAQGVKDLQRDVTQRASVDGRIGMGETTLEMTKPYTDYLLAREGKKAELASRVAGEEVADRQNTLSATRGLVSDQYGQDAGTRGEQRTERSNVQDVTAQNLSRRAGERNVKLGVDEGNQARAAAEADAQYNAGVGNVNRATGERNTGLDVETANVNRQAEIRRSALNAGLDMANTQGSNLRSGADTLARREAQIADDEAAARGEQRGERQVQVDTGRQATEDSIRQFLLEQGMEDSAFNRQLAIAQLANGGNPSAALNTASGNAARSAADSYAALQEMFRNRYGSTAG